MILDTSFIIDLLRGSAAARQKSLHIDQGSELALMTSITIFELWQGLDVKDQKKKQILHEYLGSVGLLTLDAQSAKRAGELHRDLIERGIRIESADSMIAGIALTNDQSLLTRDTHFSRIKGLKVQSY